ncbi:MAG: Crp/Fnr family transcriptional regulator [Magnetococcales bacterium]|nr:Crp/Fnr family transcriptional regulator [Magnetococcales bacterium]
MNEKIHKTLLSKRLVRGTPLFASLTEQQLDRLHRGVSRIHLEDKQILVQCGQEFTHFHQVATGVIKLNRISSSGDEKVLRLVKAGETFGTALMFMDKKCYPVNAEAVRPSDVFSIRASLFLEILRESPETCFKIMGHLSRQLSCHVSSIDGLCLQSAPCRLIRFLLESLPPNPKDLSEISLDIPKHVLASHISVKPETLSRILRDLSDRGIIEVERRCIRILDLEAFQQQGNMCEGNVCGNTE